MTDRTTGGRGRSPGARAGDQRRTEKPRLDSHGSPCTSIFPEFCTIAAPIPSSKIRAQRDRRDVPITNGGIHLTGEVQQRFWQVITDDGVRWAPRLAASSPNLPICGAEPRTVIATT